ncbi:MAG: methionyl-tRNA formyltransferase [Tannerellaceae bacterium]|jgi:methionyl-tRNA formyltransferase|nr:methionyl-tRNA formyltransferase [Tannerellaceae bacterium]
MKKSDTRIVFMGTPTFAVASLRALIEGDYQVVAVVTQPDKPVGRHGNTLQPSPVKQYALELELPVLQPVSLRESVFLETLRAFRPDLQVVVAFRMLPPEVFGLPPLGTFNLHASLLPQYRGAAPINWAIINGETQTGLTTFLLDAGMDTGRILLQRTVAIEPDDTAASLADTLMEISPSLITTTTDLLLSGIPTTPPQSACTDNLPLPVAPKLFKDNCRIQWTFPTHVIYNFIRGLSPIPAAWTYIHLHGLPPRQLKIFLSEAHTNLHPYLYTLCPEKILPVGTLIPDLKAKTLDVLTTDGYLRLLSIQLEGKKRLSVAEFLNGLPSHTYNYVSDTALLPTFVTFGAN